MKAAELAEAQSKTRTVADAVRRGILSGSLRKGSRIKSIRGLAAEFKVSNKVVESALDELERENLVVKRHGSGTFVGDSKRVRRLGVITYFFQSTIENYFEPLARLLDKREAVCLMQTWNPDIDGFSLKGIERIVDENPDGIIFETPFHNSYEKEAFKLLRGRNVCLTYIPRLDIDSLPFSAVFVDYAHMLTQAFTYFREKGRKKILLLGPGPELFSRDRVFVETAAAEAGLPMTDIRYMGFRELMGDLELLAKLFSGRDRPTAVFGFSDYFVYHVMEKLRTINPGSDVEAMGVYDLQWSKIPGREFHSFDVNFQDVWEKAVDKVFSGGRKEIQWVRPSLILRNKTSF